MKFFITTSCLVLLSLFAFSGQSEKKVAIVKLVRGDAEFLDPSGDKGKVTKDLWIKEGTIIKTEAKSFVRLNFIDKSSMNVGPKSELKIEKFSKNEAGVINVLTGKIRSKVTKDYLNMDKDKSKLFVKSRNAVMGVRGTDFLFSANKKTGASTAVLFEGSIVFNKINKGANVNDLESIVKQGRFIKPGQVSVAMRGVHKPTVPAKLSHKQFEKLNKNESFKESSIKHAKKVKSVVPPGLKGDVVASDSSALTETVKSIVKIDKKSDEKGSDKTNNKPTSDSKGFVKGDDIKPADGVVVHIDSGLVIPPGADSTFDNNTGEWVSNTNGGINSAGEYVPPEGFALNDDGQMLKVDKSGKPKEIVVLEIKPVDKMPPLDQVKTVEFKAPVANPDGPPPGPAPAGSLDDLNNEFSVPQDEIIKEEQKIEQQIDVLINSPPPPNDPSALPPPPQPFVGVYVKPNTFSGDGAPPPPPPPVASGKSRVKVQVNKK